MSQTVPWAASDKIIQVKHPHRHLSRTLIIILVRLEGDCISNLLILLNLQAQKTELPDA